MTLHRSFGSYWIATLDTALHIIFHSSVEMRLSDIYHPASGLATKWGWLGSCTTKKYICVHLASIYSIKPFVGSGYGSISDSLITMLLENDCFSLTDSSWSQPGVSWPAWPMAQETCDNWSLLYGIVPFVYEGTMSDSNLPGMCWLTTGGTILDLNLNTELGHLLLNSAAAHWTSGTLLHSIHGRTDWWIAWLNNIGRSLVLPRYHGMVV
jgi:hypothetical protein